MLGREGDPADCPVFIANKEMILARAEAARAEMRAKGMMIPGERPPPAMVLRFFLYGLVFGVVAALIHRFLFRVGAGRPARKRMWSRKNRPVPRPPSGVRHGSSRDPADGAGEAYFSERAEELTNSDQESRVRKGLRRLGSFKNLAKRVRSRPPISQKARRRSWSARSGDEGFSSRISAIRQGSPLRKGRKSPSRKRSGDAALPPRSNSPMKEGRKPPKIGGTGIVLATQPQKPDLESWIGALPSELRWNSESVLRAVTPETCNIEAVREIFMQASGDPERETPDKSSLNHIALEVDDEGIPELYRREVEKVLGPDITRFVHARAPDIEASARQLARDLMWRARRQLFAESCLPQMNFGQRLKKRWWPVPKEIIQTGSFRLCGTDRLGRPILVINGGAWEPGCFKPQVEEAYAAAILDTVQERMRYPSPQEYSRKTPSCNTWMVIFDLHTWSRANSDMATVRRLIGLLLHHYPDRLGTAIILDAPWVFHTIWSVIQTFLEDKTRRKIQFLRQSRSPGASLNAKLEELIDPTELEEAIGGLKRDRYPKLPLDAYE